MLQCANMVSPVDCQSPQIHYVGCQSPHNFSFSRSIHHVSYYSKDFLCILMQPNQVFLSDDEKLELEKRPESRTGAILYRLCGEKPGYEVGSSSQLKLSFKPKVSRKY